MQAGFQNFKDGFSNIQSKINEGLYKSDGGVGKYFEDFEKKLLVAPPRAFGIEGFLLDVIKEEQVDMENQITEHPVEDRSWVVDNVSIKPITYKIQGIVGEIFIRQDIINEQVNLVQDKLGLISQYNLPYTKERNRRVNDLKNVANKNVNYIKNAYKVGENIVNAFLQKNASNEKSRIDNAIQFFYYLRNNAIPCSITTNVLGYLENMIIKNLSISREPYTNVANFDLTFEQVIFSETKLTEYVKSLDQIAKQNGSAVQNNGQGATKETEVDKTVLAQIPLNGLIKAMIK